MEQMHGQSSSKGAKLARKLAVDLSVMTLIGAALALIGPFGSFGVPFPIRLVVWLGFAYIGYAIYSPMGWVVDRLHKALDLPLAGLWVAACLIATVPMTAVVWISNYEPMARAPLPTLEQALTHYFYVLVIGGAVTAFFHLLQSRKHTAEAEAVAAAAPSAPVRPNPPAPDQQPAPAPPAPTFLDRLPPALGSDLIALEMEDHYVRAHTALGSELVLMRLRDAIAELGAGPGAINGLQVHRSWWVARGGVEDVVRDGRNIRLLLAGGLQAPVSRANVTVLKDAGWI